MLNFGSLARSGKKRAPEKTIAHLSTILLRHRCMLQILGDKLLVMKYHEAVARGTMCYASCRRSWLTLARELTVRAARFNSWELMGRLEPLMWSNAVALSRNVSQQLG